MNKLIKNACVLAAGGVTVKLIGALYRVPLTNLLGAEGIGVYQMVFPFYTVLLTLSSIGIPSGIAALTAGGKTGAWRRALPLFGGIGFLFSLIMFFGAGKIAYFQGNISAANAYKALSPSVFAVSVISCFRGYHQGKSKMAPTAVSQMIEQSVKAAVGISACVFLGDTPAEKAAFAAGAVTVSEYAALFYLLLLKRDKKEQKNEKPAYKLVIATILPIILSSATLPAARLIDSFTFVRLLKSADATAKFGIFCGVVESVVGLPIALCHSLAVGGLPLVAKGTKPDKMISYTLIFSVLLAAATFAFADLVVSLLFPALGSENKLLAVRLIRVSSPSVVGLSLVQTFSAVFIGKGKQGVPPRALIIGVAVKITTTFLLVPNEKTGVYGYAISDIFCYFVAMIVFLLYIIFKEKKEGEGSPAAVGRSVNAA